MIHRSLVRQLSPACQGKLLDLIANRNCANYWRLKVKLLRKCSSLKKKGPSAVPEIALQLIVVVYCFPGRREILLLHARRHWLIGDLQKCEDPLQRIFLLVSEIFINNVNLRVVPENYVGFSSNIV